jgi:hypothetical protein
MKIQKIQNWWIVSDNLKIYVIDLFLDKALNRALKLKYNA